MPEPIRLYILAGEASGDRLGADLLRRLRARTPLVPAGVGGTEMQLEGLSSQFPMNDLAVMGVADVLRRLPLLLRRLRECARAILLSQPDVVVLIDSQVFSQMLARRLRRRGFRRPILLYVSPTVWVRAPERAAKLVPLFDAVLAVLPFEPAAMARLRGPPTYFVGHPALADAQETPADGQRIALLPGSRPGELRRHLPLLRDTASALAAREPALSFYMPTLPDLVRSLRDETRSWAVPVSIEPDRSLRARLYAETRLALAVSGTVTLELAIASVPMVVVYHMDRAQTRHYARLGRPRVSLPNILLEADVVPEIILDRAEAAPLTAAALTLLDDIPARRNQASAFARLRALMGQGSADHPREDPAARVLAMLEAYRLPSGA